MHRVNIILDDEAWLALQEIPKGARSKLIGESIKKLSETERREKAARRMDALRKRMPPVSSAELVSWIREDRQRKR
jgi:hypothetical protein